MKHLVCHDCGRLLSENDCVWLGGNFRGERTFCAGCAQNEWDYVPDFHPDCPECTGTRTCCDFAPDSLGDDPNVYTDCRWHKKVLDGPIRVESVEWIDHIKENN